MKVQLHGILFDNQDGGYTVELYPDASSRLAAQVERNDGDVVDVEDEYENGYYAHHEIELEFDDNGVLIKSASLSFGQ